MEHKRLIAESQLAAQSSVQNEYFNNSLKSEAKRFSSLILSNSITSIDDKKIYFKFFLLTLEKPAQERSEAQVQAIAKILKEEKLFPEFKNNLTILRLLAKQIKMRHLQPNHFLFTCNTKDENIYKLLKGEIAVKKIRDGTTAIKRKGELLQSFQDFKLIKDTEAQSKEQIFVIALNYHQYEYALKLQKQNKNIMQMLVKTSIFSKFKRKELLYLIQSSQEISLVCKEVLFSQADANNGFFYFLIEGELAVYKTTNGYRKQVVCYVTEGSLIGEESLFDEDRPRIYTVLAQSSHAKILQISCIKLQQAIKLFELNVEQILTEKYQDFLALRDKHYHSQHQENSQMRLNFQTPKIFTKMSPVKQEQMTNLLKDVENFTLKINTKKKMMEKRYPNGKDYSRLISVERPLFGKQAPQSLKSLVKRYAVNEVRPKENCKLPHL